MYKKTKNYQYFKRFIISNLTLLLLILAFSICASANDERIHTDCVIVSMGDSYSSGEGIEPFFGQENERGTNLDWLAHRSQQAWSGMLTLPGVTGVMSDEQNKDVHWYFVAASGATTEHITAKQSKEYQTAHSYDKKTAELPPQLEVFKQLEKEGKRADYVTLTLGGNDADFTGVIKTVVLGGNSYLKKSWLSDKLNYTWQEYYKSGGIKDKLRTSYIKIAESAGEQAHIIVAGYPQLLNPNGHGVVISDDEAELVNTAVHNFNKEIEKLVEQCEKSAIAEFSESGAVSMSDFGMNISFVSVEKKFKGHEAYTDNPFINEIMKPQEYDLVNKINGITSSYSMHPNKKGAIMYAACVQDEIDRLEKTVEADEIQGKDAYDIYQTASAQTMASGNWREELNASAIINVKSEDEREKATVNATIDMYADVQDYDSDDLTKTKITGAADISAAGQKIAWTVDYSDGIAHYQYTAPDQYSGDVEVDPICFDFSNLTNDMMQDIIVSGNKVQFTVTAEQMTKMAGNAVNMFSGMELLGYGDGDIEITLDSNMETIDSINMQFSASMIYQGYHADVDYDMIYRFIPAEAKEETADSENSTGVYDPIFYEYAKAISYYTYNGNAGLEEKYPYANEYLVTNYKADGYPICYAYYDIDGNGIDELLFSYVCIPGYEWKLVDVFTYDPESEQIKNIGERELFSAYAGSAIYEDGIIYSSKSAQETFYKLNPDGYHLDIVNQYTEIGTYPNRYYFNDTEMMDMEEFETMRATRALEVTFNWQEYDPFEWVADSADQNSSQPSITGYAGYDEIIRKYYQGIMEGWTGEKYIENGLCYLAKYDAQVSDVGYYITDIDGNGTNELIIGNMTLEGENYKEMFYDLYTTVGNNPVLLSSSGERDCYYWCMDGTIAEFGSSSALESSWHYYRFEGDELILRESVFFDAYYDENNPWFYSTSGSPKDYSMPITEEDAHEIINSYSEQYIKIPYIPLSDMDINTGIL